MDTSTRQVTSRTYIVNLRALRMTTSAPSSQLPSIPSSHSLLLRRSYAINSCYKRCWTDLKSHRRICNMVVEPRIATESFLKENFMLLAVLEPKKASWNTLELRDIGFYKARAQRLVLLGSKYPLHCLQKWKTFRGSNTTFFQQHWTDESQHRKLAACHINMTRTAEQLMFGDDWRPGTWYIRLRNRPTRALWKASGKQFYANGRYRIVLKLSFVKVGQIYPRQWRCGWYCQWCYCRRSRV